MTILPHLALPTPPCFDLSRSFPPHIGGGGEVLAPTTRRGKDGFRHFSPPCPYATHSHLAITDKDYNCKFS